jgi:hypothetical protein
MADNLATFMCTLSLKKSGILKLLVLSGSVQSCNGIAVPLVTYGNGALASTHYDFPQLMRRPEATMK